MQSSARSVGLEVAIVHFESRRLGEKKYNLQGRHRKGRCTSKQTVNVGCILPRLKWTNGPIKSQEWMGCLRPLTQTSFKLVTQFSPTNTAEDRDEPKGVCIGG